MTFVNFWPIYLGAAALALPLAVHWLTRPRPRRLPLSTLRFVREVVAQRRARHRLRDVLILALRMAAIALLAAALARPLVGKRPLVSPAAEGARQRVVLLDASLSMGAAEQGIQAFERARARAAEYLGFTPGLRANLVTAAAQPHAVFDRSSTNFVALRDELGRAQVRPERLNVAAALKAAGELLAAGATSDDSDMELVIVSDFQRANWSAADFSILPQQTRIELESIAARPAPANLAITRVGFGGRGTVGEEALLEVEVGNFGPSARKVEVEVSAAETAYRLSGDCPAGARTTLSQNIVTRQPGWQGGTARLVDVDDALETDNRRAFVLETRAAPQYLLVSSQSAGAGNPSSFYLERALAPLDGREGATTAHVRRVESGRFDGEAAAGVELAVLDHPGPLSADKLQLLAGLLRRGRGLLYVACEPVDATNLARLVELLGGNLQLPVEFLPTVPGQRRTDLYLAEIKRNASPFTVFGDAVLDNLAGLRFRGGLASKQLAGASADDLLASYNDRSASLVVTDSAAGTLAVWNVDLANSNLPASAAFVPLVGELVDRLLDPARRERLVECGETLAVYLPAEAGAPDGLAIEPPAGGEAPGELISENLGTMWQAASVGGPGVYRVRRGDATVFALAAELPADESDLERLDPAVLSERLAGGRQIHYREMADETGETDDLWTLLAIGAVVALLGEMVLLRLFRT